MGKSISTLRYCAKFIRSAMMDNMAMCRIGQLCLDIIDKIDEEGGSSPSGRVDWDNLDGKPSTFPPSAHKHNSSDINNFGYQVISAIQDEGLATQAWVEWYAAQTNLQPKDFKPTINSDYNGLIQELYIDGSYEGQMAIYLLQDTADDTRLFISDGNGGIIGKCEIDGSESFLAGNIYEINEQNSSGFHGYVVFAKNKPTPEKQYIQSDSIINNSCKNIMNAPTIFNKIFGWLAPKKDNVVKWTTTYEAANTCIKEFYYPNCPSGAMISLLTNNDSEVAVFIKNASGNYIAKCCRQINKNIRNTEPIYSIYDYTSERTHLGYMVFSKTIDYTFGSDNIINRSAVIDINNSPRVKAMLADQRQLILLGDSIPSLMATYETNGSYITRGQENPLADMLRSMLGCQVINLCCEGCTYTLRSSLATNYYDKFSGVKWADSLKVKSFSTQKNATVGSNIGYPHAVANTSLVDFNKITTVISEYGTNDLTIGMTLGVPYSGSTPSKTTILGSMNYTAKTILDTYPQWKFAFVNLFNRHIDGTPISLYTNANNLSARELRAALAQNAEIMGLPIIAGTDMCERNEFSLMTSTCDGTHNNQVGFFALAKFFERIYKQLNGDDREETAVVMDITGDGGNIGTDTPDDSGNTGGDSGGTDTPPTTELYEVNNVENWASGQKWDGHSCWQSPKILHGQCTTITVTPNNKCTLHIYSAGEENYDYLYCTTYSDDVSWQSSADKPRVISGQDKGGVINQRKWLSAELTAGTTYYIRYVKDGSTDNSPDCGWWYID